MFLFVVLHSNWKPITNKKSHGTKGEFDDIYILTYRTYISVARTFLLEKTVHIFYKICMSYTFFTLEILLSLEFIFTVIADHAQV